MKKIIPFILLMSAHWSFSQTYKPDLQDKSQLSAGNKTYKSINEDGHKGINIEEGQRYSIIRINNIDFSNGVIDIDLKGRNMDGRSFVGIAFHIQNDSTYDAIYFRAFNFSNPDTIRRSRAVQYVSLPQYDWSRLRETFPGKYENKVNPVPDSDGWFHCRIIVKDKLVTAFVNNSITPSLVVNKLSSFSNGQVGLWVGNGSDGSFANLEIKKQ